MAPFAVQSALKAIDAGHERAGGGAAHGAVSPRRNRPGVHTHVHTRIPMCTRFCRYAHACAHACAPLQAAIRVRT
eukprot:1632843-Rhodomonas_salina.1